MSFIAGKKKIRPSQVLTKLLSRVQISYNMELTSLFNAAVAVKRSAGSIARRVSINGNDDGGKSLNVSFIQRLYDC